MSSTRSHRTPCFPQILNPIDGTFGTPPDLLVYTQEFIAPVATPAKVQRLPHGIVPPPPVDLADIHDGEFLISFESRRDTIWYMLIILFFYRSYELKVILARHGLSALWESVESREMGLLDVYFVLGEHSPLASIIPSSSSADLRLLPYVQAIYAPLSESSRVIKASELSRALSGPAFLGDDFLDPTSGISIVVSRHLGLDGVTPMAEVFRYVLPDGVCVLHAVFLSSTSELTVVSLLNSQWIDLAHQTTQPGAL